MLVSILSALTKLKRITVPSLHWFLAKFKSRVRRSLVKIYIQGLTFCWRQSDLGLKYSFSGIFTEASGAPSTKLPQSINDFQPCFTVCIRCYCLYPVSILMASGLRSHKVQFLVHFMFGALCALLSESFYFLQIVIMDVMSCRWF